LVTFLSRSGDHRDEVFPDQPFGAERARQLPATDEPGAAQALALHVARHLARAVHGDRDARRWSIEFLAREHPAALALVAPLAEAEALLVGLAAEERRIQRTVELGVPVILGAAFEARKPIEAAVRRTDEAVDAGGDVVDDVHGVTLP